MKDGLKRIFGDSVHCFFVEPTLYPSVLLGVATQKFEKANVHDFGIHGLTAADGLACASPSCLVTRIMTNHLSGDVTVCDRKLYDFMRLLDKSEHITVEPSGCAAFAGAIALATFAGAREYLEKQGIGMQKLENSTQIAWATGGSMVPEEEYKKYYMQGVDAYTDF